MNTDNNYFKFLDRLEERYGDKDRMILLLLDDFLGMELVGQDAKDLRRFHDEVCHLADEMKQLGEDVDGNPLWRRVLISKMRGPLRLKIFEKLGKNPLSAPSSVMMECLYDYLRTLEVNAVFSTCQAQTTPAVDDSSDPSSPQCCEEPVLSTDPVDAVKRVPTAVDTTIADEELKERRTCPLCGLLHSAADCTVYDTTKKRLRRALKLNLCLLCLREGHPAVSCPRRTTRPCPTCRRGQHNRALCKNANQRNDRHPSQVCATGDSSCDPKASDQQRYSRTSVPAKRSCRIAEQSVIRDVTSCVTIATTLRQSGTQSSHERISGNLMNRKKRTKDLGTDPPGRTGTNRPPTTSTDQSIKQHGAEAYGSDRLLPGRYNHLQTDTCSTNREMLQFDRALSDGSDEVPDGMPDEKLSR
ncbi:Zinc knuckle family protein [Aphelenchoides avenae]|nr:Zinc knuckle family protein [Aphelenchus avenae]